MLEGKFEWDFFENGYFENGQPVFQKKPKFKKFEILHFSIYSHSKLPSFPICLFDGCVKKKREKYINFIYQTDYLIFGVLTIKNKQ